MSVWWFRVKRVDWTKAEISSTSKWSPHVAHGSGERKNKYIAEKQNGEATSTHSGVPVALAGTVVHGEYSWMKKNNEKGPHSRSVSVASATVAPVGPWDLLTGMDSAAHEGRAVDVKS